MTVVASVDAPGRGRTLQHAARALGLAELRISRSITATPELRGGHIGGEPGSSTLETTITRGREPLAGRNRAHGRPLQAISR